MKELDEQYIKKFDVEIKEKTIDKISEMFYFVDICMGMFLIGYAYGIIN